MNQTDAYAKLVDALTKGTNATFDIETGRDPFWQFDQETHDKKPPANWKDPVKIHDWWVAEEKKAGEKAALSPISGFIICIGYAFTSDDGKIISFSDDANGMDDDSEADLLRRFWYLFEISNSTWSGFNIFSFDLEFMINRSWINGVKVPRSAWGASVRYPSNRFVDTAVLFAGGDRHSYTKLSVVLKAMGIDPKTEDIGAQFMDVYLEDRERALRYSAGDADREHQLADKMGAWEFGSRVHA